MDLFLFTSPLLLFPVDSSPNQIDLVTFSPIRFMPLDLSIFAFVYLREIWRQASKNAHFVFVLLVPFFFFTPSGLSNSSFPGLLRFSPLAGQSLSRSFYLACFFVHSMFLAFPFSLFPTCSGLFFAWKDLIRFVSQRDKKLLTV